MSLENNYISDICLLYTSDGGSFHLWPEPGKAGSRIFLSLRSEHGSCRVSSGKKSIPCRNRPGRISRGPVLSDPAGVSARGGYGLSLIHIFLKWQLPKA